MNAGKMILMKFIHYGSGGAVINYVLFFTLQTRIIRCLMYCFKGVLVFYFLISKSKISRRSPPMCEHATFLKGVFMLIS